ncbi:uncharacterized protein IL334_000082 [Kwoniella shivajii]|uniref:PX domain-containing protein n=1 Tax=Kwoniella shivajii TaxID=564305 RepID=A0ABZ1CP74_9TREE|nr:hypothetical protein IL334_000082 [Kwoniella shivajii]
MDDPLSPSNINPSWSDTPTSSSSFSTTHTQSQSQHLNSPHTQTQHTPPPTSTSNDTFSREPKVFGAPGLGLVSPHPPPSSSSSTYEDTQSTRNANVNGNGTTTRKEAPNSFLRVRIGGLERNRKDLLIRFDASTNLPNFRTSMYRNMQRSYVEFQKFAEQAQLCCPQTIIPALPLPSTSAVTDEEDDRLVRIALQRWFTRICEDPVLTKDDELRSFIESDFGYSPVPPPSARKSSAASAATGVFSAALSKVVRRGPLDEDDELQSAKTALDKLEERWGSAATSISNVGKSRRAFAVSNADVGAKLISLSTVESDMHLASAERKFGRTWEHLSGMLGAQAASENVILSDSLGYQALNARAAKEALVQRTTLLEDSQTATKTAINKRRNVERLKGSSKIDPVKVDDALHEMEEANTLETSLSNRLNAISQNLHLAIRSHSKHAHEDITIALLEASRMSVMYHKQHLRELESLKPDLNKIGTSATIISTPTASASSKNVSVTTPKRSDVGLPPQPAFQQPVQQGQARVISQSRQQQQQSQQQQQQQPPPMAGMIQGYAPVPPIGPGKFPLNQSSNQPAFNQRQQQPQASFIPQQQQQQQYSQQPRPPYQQQQQIPQPYQQQQSRPGQMPGYIQPQQSSQGYNQQPPFPQQGQSYSQNQQQSRGYLNRPPQPSGPGYMDGSKSMFLPPSSQSHLQRPNSAGPPPLHQQGQIDPLGGGMMSQSMMLPSNGRGTPQSMGGRPQRKLDERQVARMLAGGF